MSVLLKPIQYALNAALRQDPETAAKLAHFESKKISVVIEDLQQNLTIVFEQQQLTLFNELQDADLTISAKSFELLKLLQHPDNLFSAEIHIHGDVQFAKQLQDVFNHFDFDWEQQIANITGDTIGQPLTYGLKQSFAWLKDTHESLQTSASEYLREEIKLLPHQIQVDDYMQAIDTLRADTDRLEARIKRLQKKRGL